VGGRPHDALRGCQTEPLGDVTVCWTVCMDRTEQVLEQWAQRRVQRRLRQQRPRRMCNRRVLLSESGAHVEAAQASSSDGRACNRGSPDKPQVWTGAAFVEHLHRGVPSFTYRRPSGVPLHRKVWDACFPKCEQHSAVRRGTRVQFTNGHAAPGKPDPLLLGHPTAL
jgi:hypothetical protein